MNVVKLKNLEKEFLNRYPKGFRDESCFPKIKKYNPQKLEDFAKEALKKENFSNPNLLIEGFLKIIQKSVMVSLFDKIKLKDAIFSLNTYEKDMLSIEIYELLYGNKKNGFEGLVEFLAQYNLARWTIISLTPYCINRHHEYFIKPTTTKMIIKFFELNELIYKAKPSFEFYENYTKALDEIKTNLHESLTFDNVAFTSFLKVAIEFYED